MAFSAEQVAYAGQASIDLYEKKKPVDLINTERPLLKALQRTKRTFPGAKQYIHEQLRTSNDSNFQWFGPDGVVTYNRKRTLDGADFPWGSAHDGFGLTEEELLQNGISMTDTRSAKPTASEKVAFVNLMNENLETLDLGFMEKFDYELHLDGTQDAESVAGLDLLIATDPTSGTVGGIDRSVSANTFWRNQVALDIPVTSGVLVETMEQVWRACGRVGGNNPDLILAGSKFVDAYRVDAKTEIGRQIQIAPTSKDGVNLDPSITGLYFKGVPISWDPVMDDLEAALSPTEEWDKRCYFINTRFLKLRPAEGQDMIPRSPPRVYNRYTHYWAKTWRGGLTITNPGAMAVLHID
jgi:hypothetical protein